MEEQQITLQIDHHFITVPAGTTLLEAARKIGIDIPTLCHINLKGTCIKNNPASCRICVVEVEGRKNLAPACATRCTDGMVVRTSTLRVMNARKIVAELILSDHPNECLTCPKSGNCRILLSASISAKCRLTAANFRPGSEKLLHPLYAIWINASFAAVARVYATTYKPWEH